MSEIAITQEQRDAAAEWGAITARLLDKRLPEKERAKVRQLAAMQTFSMWNGDATHRPALRRRESPPTFVAAGYREDIRVSAWQTWVSECLRVASYNAGCLVTLMGACLDLDGDATTQAASDALRRYLAFECDIREIPASRFERNRLAERRTSLDGLIAATPRPPVADDEPRRGRR